MFTQEFCLMTTVVILFGKKKLCDTPEKSYTVTENKPENMVEVN